MINSSTHNPPPGLMIVFCISVIDQGTGPIKLFMLSVVLKVFIDFILFYRFLLIFVQSISLLLLKVLEGIFIFGTTYTNKAYKML